MALKMGTVDGQENRKEMEQPGMIVEENPDREALARVVREAVEGQFAKKFGRPS